MRLHTLKQMLMFKRPMGSRTERNFRQYFLFRSMKDAWEDDHGNIHVLIARKDRKWPKTMFSSHTDTVHRVEGFQKLALERGTVMLAPFERSNCLGADCTVGVWLMREMILNKVPGHYVFHWGEERGCIGSTAVVKKNPEYFKRAKAIIAFDRRGDDEVITHQRSQRMCSDVFAESVSAMLPRGYGPSQNGIYTDSAEYSQVVPECTNISVGYQHEHSSNETLDLKVPVLLLTSILKFWDEDNLIIERDPKGPIELKRSKALHAWEHAPAVTGNGSTSKGEYHVWENGHLVKYANEQARMDAWLRRRAEEDDSKLSGMVLPH